MNTNPDAKRILCYGDSITKGESAMGSGEGRFSVLERWTGVLQGLLGDKYEILEQGLSGRTTGSDDVKKGAADNGLVTLPVALRVSGKIDLIIYMLGTNDVQVRKKALPEKSLNNIILALRLVRERDPETKILVMSPPIIKEDLANKVDGNQWIDGKEESLKLEELLEKEFGNQKDVFFLKTSDYIETSSLDGVHLDKENNKILAKVLHKKILAII